MRTGMDQFPNHKVDSDHIGRAIRTKARYSSVTQPSDALFTLLMYL